MNKELIVSVCAAVILFFAPFAHSQQSKKVWRVGLIHVGLDHVPQAPNTLRESLKVLGYEEGKNIRIDWHNLADEAAAVEMAKKLVRDHVDLIVAWENQAVRAAKSATPQIPIVFISVTDPVADGFVKSLARSRWKPHRLCWPPRNSGQTVGAF
jgi:putative ABC transport system substrate-binding protein